MVDLSVTIGRLKLKNPVIAASGTFGPEYGELVNIRSLGALVMKTVTLKARIGNIPPRIVETASGMLNSIGLENKGIDDFMDNKLPAAAKYNIPIIASIAGDDETEYKALARHLDTAKRVLAIEVNLSCPNVKHGKRENLIAQDARATASVITAVRRNSRKTIIAKLSPNVTDIKQIAAAAQDAGADALSLVNTFTGLAVDIETGRPKLGNITGGLSGPAIKPIALKMVWEAYNKVKIPIIGMGGIMDHKDAIEFFLCGASAIQIGTANFIDPGACIEVIKGLEKYLKRNKIDSVNKLTGALAVGDI